MLALLWMTVATLAAPDEALTGALHLAVRTFTLENGMRVVIHEDHRAPLLAVHVQVGVGSSDDPIPGMAHLFEHLMYEGSVHAPAGAYDTWLTAAGGDDNAWTDHDFTAYHLLAPPGAIDLALFLESDRLGWFTGAIDASAVANQVAVVSAERGISEDEPGGMNAALLGAALWPEGHPYHQPVAGSAPALATVRLADVEAFHRAWYRPADATLVVAGDVDASQVEERVRYWFSDVAAPTVQAPPRAAAPDLPTGERRYAAVDVAHNVTLLAAWPTVPRGHPDEPALDLLAEVLSSGRGSRLDDALYFRHRQVEGVAAWTDNGRLGGSLVVEVRDRHASARRLQRLLDRELDRLARRPATRAELDRRKARWRAWYLRATEDLESRAAVLADCTWTTGEPDCLEWDFERHMAVTPEDLARVAGQWLRDDRRVLLSVVSAERGGDGLPHATPLELP